MIGTDLNIELMANAALKMEDRKLKKALSGFESLFILQLLKSMRAAYLNDERRSGLGKSTFLSIADQSLADHIAEKGGLGIAKLLHNQLSDENTHPNNPDPINIERQHIPPKLDDKLQSPNTLTAAKIEGPPELDRNANIASKQPVQKSQNDDADGQYEQIGIKREHTNIIDKAISKASEKYNLPENLIAAMIKAESGGNPQAVSSKGAKGLMQLIDSTAADMGVIDQFDPEDNIMGGARYMKKLLDHFRGNLKLALAAYNAGPGNVQKFGGIPPFSETKHYINRVLKFMNESNHDKDSGRPADKPYREEGWITFTGK